MVMGVDKLNAEINYAVQVHGQPHWTGLKEWQ